MRKSNHLFNYYYSYPQVQYERFLDIFFRVRDFTKFRNDYTKKK